MAREAKSESQEFDIDGLRQLMELMEKHDLSELKMQQGESKYLLRRGAQTVTVSAAPAQLAAPPPAAPVAAAAPAPAGAAPATAADEGLLEIKSPTVGTFYQSPSPGDPAFVNVGDRVTPASIVCIVEAMKVFNQIPADVAGTIAKVLLKDGDSVEYGQPLFLVNPN